VSLPNFILLELQGPIKQQKQAFILLFFEIKTPENRCVYINIKLRDRNIQILLKLIGFEI